MQNNLMNINELKKKFQDDFMAGKILTDISETGRFYVIGNIRIPVTTNEEVLRQYEALVLNAQPTVANTAMSLLDLPRLSIFVGQPDTGKTYLAVETAKMFVPKPERQVLYMCHNEVTLSTLLESFSLKDGKPCYQESVAMKLISDPNDEPAVIILDEFNTMNTNAMKSLQPLFDNTSKTFVFRSVDANGNTVEKVCHKNLNCKFILTMNEKDAGVSKLPNAILSRSKVKYFKPVDDKVLSSWTGVPEATITQYRTIYKTIKLEELFGSRQINSLKNATLDEIINHLSGLLALNGQSSNLVESIEVRNLINKLLMKP